jgi:hypothetical protein
MWLTRKNNKKQGISKNGMLTPFSGNSLQITEEKICWVRCPLITVITKFWIGLILPKGYFLSNYIYIYI